MENKEKNKNHKTRDIIIMIIIIIIIILLLLHNCVSLGKKESGGKQNVIDICDGNDCDVRPGGKENLIDCITDADNPLCIIPDFTGKTQKDVDLWLSKIANNLDIGNKVIDSLSQDGTIINQSNQKGQTVKDLLDGNIPLIITFANTKNAKVDCLTDVNNELCKVPDFTGKTKEDVLKWLEGISNNINPKFSTEKSKEKDGTAINQSIKEGVTVKEILDNNLLLDITFSNNDKIDCLEDETNEVCIIPNFTGSTKKEIEDWLNSISNNINTNYGTRDSDSKNGTVIDQSAKPGSTVKDLINSGKPLNIIFSNRTDSKVDCLKNPNSKNCIVPDFTDKTKEDVDKWLEGILNNVDITYIVKDSEKENGIITDQSNKNISVKDIIEGNKDLIITTSNNKKTKVDCLTDINNEACVVPDFTGKTQKDVLDWLNSIANDIDSKFEEKKSDKENGTVVEQSVKSGTLVKDLLESNNPITIVFSNNNKVDCLKDVDNPNCIIPNFTGDTIEEVETWLSTITNKINTNYTTEESTSTKGTVTKQSPKSGMTVKELLDNNKTLDLTFAKEKESKIDCLTDVNNSACIIPDFTGKTQKDVKEWLNKISNNIKVNYSREESVNKVGTITKQTPNGGKTVKDLLDSNGSLNITIAKEKNTKVDCLKDVNNKLCIIPDFTGKTEKDVKEWLNKISNNIDIEYVEEESSENVGTITKQSPNNGNTVKDLLDGNKTLVITISKGEPENTGELVVKDNNVTWDKNTSIDIFANPLFNGEAKIAPESSNTYRFEINNNTIYNIKYTLSFIETNEYNINMKYKLRKNNTYLFEDYVSASELIAENITLNSSKTDTYYLEWKWISSDNDTEIGKNSNSTYELKIDIKAESINE